MIQRLVHGKYADGVGMKNGDMTNVEIKDNGIRRTEAENEAYTI